MIRRPPSNVVALFPKKQRGGGGGGRLTSDLYEAEKRAQRAGTIAIDAYTMTGSSFYAVRKSLDAAKAYGEVADLFEQAGRPKRAKLFRATRSGFLAEAKFFYAQLRRQGRDEQRAKPTSGPR